MLKYDIKKQGIDFDIDYINSFNKGTRKKFSIIDSKNKNKAFFKYEKYDVSESCSEKISYEIAKVLGYKCAKIELAKDVNNNLGVLNYWFIDLHNEKHIDLQTEEHIDIVSYLNINTKERSKYYTISNIRNQLDKIDANLFKDFIKIMVFDALIGEQDRHEENWGITKVKNKYTISPLYDNGCSLLKDFKQKEYAEKFYNGEKNFDAYVLKSRTYIYKEDNKTRYKHFELIKYLYEHYPDDTKNEILNLKKLSDKKIENIINRIPDDLLTNMHKNYIIIYLKKRKKLLLNILTEVKI